MGNLQDFSEYVSGRAKVAAEIERRLCALQAKYESFYAEVTKVRESELDQLSEHLRGDRARLPADLIAELDRAGAAVKKEFDAELARLEEEEADMLAVAEKARQRSREEEKRLHRENEDLDRQEEDLKRRNEELLAGIERFNGEIRKLGSGFGFFSNVFRMRDLRQQRERLDEEQAKNAAFIDNLRKLWVERDQEHAAKEAELQSAWTKERARAAALRAKIDYMRDGKPAIVFRSTVEKALLARTPGAVPEAGPDDPQCPRCKTRNAARSHFCLICAQRLLEDRPDLEGSLEEIAEANAHWLRFSDGMRACQRIIALIRGFRSGLEAFHKSVTGMLNTQQRHSLRVLDLDVPQWSRDYGRNLERVLEAVSVDHSLHPREFARRVDDVLGNVLTEDKVKQFFDAMGKELSKQAKAQWG